MKKLILGTSAIVAASTLAATPTVAAEKIKLGLSGYLQTSFVVADYDNGDQLPTDIRHEGEVHFTGETTLDNGLTFGVNIQLEARQDNDQVDETYMYVEGAFGRINVGSENSAAYLMHYASPSPVPAWSLNDPNAEAGGFETPATSATEVSDADKITYFTPRFSGFQLGVSYTPDGDEETGTASPYAIIADEGAEDEAYSIGANYSGKIGSVALNASLGYDLITRSTSDDTDEITGGFNVGFGGFVVGAGYKFTDNDDGTDDRERHDYNVGVTYGQGPWKVGVQYAGIDLDDAADGHLDAVVVGGQYVLGPGITAFGGVQFFEGEDDLEGDGGENATVFFVGTALTF
ncbi:porin [Sneathiella glossodoripedis]|uniref:porin n=1 Tax=Sneathiella glossodoripedis TaxID=418853 RepID=UPI000470CF66|nr:porin [Sneathiella glossodoripedis]